MALKELDNSNINKHLGQSSQYKSQYDPSLLVREERQSNRTHLNLTDDNLPFTGNDVWNAYEVSGLTDKGLPVTGVAKIVYPCTGKYIVESKSLKLYFNSFNSTPLGESPDDVRDNIASMAEMDLSDYLNTDVRVSVFSNEQVLHELATPSQWHDITFDLDSDKTTDIPAYSHNTRSFSHNSRESNYISLEDSYPVEEINFDTYTETPELLTVIEDAPIECVHYHSALLKSNCRVTSQPDWGDVYIDIKSRNTVDPISLLKYIVSFRDECHFHEEICETIFVRLNDLLQPEKLAVRCLYARRGGIDINPERISQPGLAHYDLNNINIPHVKTPKQ